MGLTINEAIYNLENGSKGKIAVFIYSGSENPAEVLRNAIFEYVGKEGHHELIDANLDNPWMRVVVSEINGMKQEKYDSKKHKLLNGLSDD